MKKRNVIAWLAIGLSILATCFWAFWGIIENFHEGWYSESFWKNIQLMFLQYLSPMFILLVLSLFAIRYPKLGAILFLITGFLLSRFVNNYVLNIPFVLLAILYWFSRLEDKKWAYRLMLGLPLLTLIICGAEPIYRISGRYDDGNTGKRLIRTEHVDLIWAPQGPGWPRDGVDWFEADSICRHLTDDGLECTREPQNIWRLPTIEECVHSMHRHGKLCNGRLTEADQPVYSIKPDKESPLWDVHSQVIYWWTANEIDSNHAYIIVYDGRIWERRKDIGPNYMGYRAVRSAE